MRINKNGRNVIYFFTALAIFSLFSIRDNYFISDALNYIEHARRDFDFLESSNYLYPVYWMLLGFLRLWLDPELVPAALSLIISILIIFSSLKLKGSERWIFLFFCIFSSIIFNTTQVALRNGVALGFVLLGLAYGRTVLLVIAPLVHPGIFPIVAVLILLRYASETKKIMTTAIILGLAVFFLAPYFDQIMEARGYAQEGSSRLAGMVTYVAVISLAGIYFFSLSGSPYRFFMPIMVGIWIFVGLKYEFGGRLFLQSFLISLFLLLKFSRAGDFKKWYLLGFLFFSAYGSILWHPLVAYYDGWLGYWISKI